MKASKVAALAFVALLCLTVPAFAQVGVNPALLTGTTIVALPITTRADVAGSFGDITRGDLPIAIPLGVGAGFGFRMIIDLSLATNPLALLEWAYDLSHDGGLTWHPSCGASAPGGFRLDKQGLPLAFFQCGLGDPTNPLRLIRGTFSVIGSETFGILLSTQ